MNEHLLNGPELKVTTQTQVVQEKKNAYVQGLGGKK